MDAFDPTAKPFHLGRTDVRWVEETLASLDTKGKVGQLFCPNVQNCDEGLVHWILKEMKPAGMMFRPKPKEEMLRTHALWQDSSEIPLLIPANLETGGNGVTTDGTLFSYPMGVAATDDPGMAYRLGLVCGREARAVGSNWAFAPVIDIDRNCFNPITNVRTYGSDVGRVLRMAREYVRGLRESGIAESIKHWPGDGMDGRDQHLVMTRNTLSVEEWKRTYGAVYKAMIDDGALTVMCAHIAFPAYMRVVHPGIRDQDMLPATLTPELTFGLLRRELGFNGLIVSDATCMLGLTGKGKRSELVPRVVAAGSDIFLFDQDVREDYRFMLRGVEEGIVSEARLDQAVMRVLALKAALKLHEKKREGTLVPSESGLSTVGCAEHREWARECADRSITLVKDTQKLLPISPDTHGKVLLFGFGRLNEMFGDDERPIASDFADALRARGFQVTVFDGKRMGHEVFFSSVERFRDSYDLAIYFAFIPPYSNTGNLRISWMPPLGFDTPWFLHEKPTLFISCANPYHLYDVPDIKTFVNCYTNSPTVLDELMDKLMGRKPFHGKSPVDPFCGLEEAKP